MRCVLSFTRYSGLLKRLYLGFYLSDFVHFSHVGVKFDTGYDGDILKRSRGPCQARNYPTFGYLTIGAWPRLLDSLDEAFRGVY